MLGLPLARWAARFDRGAVRVRGRLDDGGPVDLSVRLEGGRVLGDAEGLRATVERLHDPVVTGYAETDAGLLVKVVPGFTARVAPGTRVSVEAAAGGPPEEPRLTGPLAISVDGDGVGVVLLGVTLTVRGGTLSPDGVVRLVGDGWLARSVLRLASRQLTREVQRAARFAEVRRFLRVGGPSERSRGSR